MADKSPRRTNLRLARAEMHDLKPERSERPDLRPGRPDLRPERPDLRPERTDLRPERANFRPKRPDLRPEWFNLRPERPNLRPERPWRPDLGGGDGRTNKRMNERTNGRTKVPLCSTGLRPLRGRCPKNRTSVTWSAVPNAPMLVYVGMR